MRARPPLGLEGLVEEAVFNVVASKEIGHVVPTVARSGRIAQGHTSGIAVFSRRVNLGLGRVSHGPQEGEGEPERAGRFGRKSAAGAERKRVNSPCMEGRHVSSFMIFRPHSSSGTSRPSHGIRREPEGAAILASQPARRVSFCCATMALSTSTAWSAFSQHS